MAEPYLYFMDISFNFLLQATRVLHVGNYDEEELILIFDYIKSIDKPIIENFKTSSNILGYENDLELYMEIVDVLIKIYEDKEEYEKCDILIKKKDLI